MSRQEILATTLLVVPCAELILHTSNNFFIEMSFQTYIRGCKVQYRIKTHTYILTKNMWIRISDSDKTFEERLTVCELSLVALLGPRLISYMEKHLEFSQICTKSPIWQAIKKFLLNHCYSEKRGDSMHKIFAVTNLNKFSCHSYYKMVYANFLIWFGSLYYKWLNLNVIFHA